MAHQAIGSERPPRNMPATPSHSISCGVEVGEGAVVVGEAAGGDGREGIGHGVEGAHAADEEQHGADGREHRVEPQVAPQQPDERGARRGAWPRPAPPRPTGAVRPRPGTGSTATMVASPKKPAEPLGERPPEQDPAVERLEIGDDGERRGGEAGGRLEQGVVSSADGPGGQVGDVTRATIIVNAATNTERRATRGGTWSGMGIDHRKAAPDARATSSDRAQHERRRRRWRPGRRGWS